MKAGAAGGEMTHRWKQMISIACLTKHIRGVWQLLSRGFGKRNSDGCCLHTWLAGRLSGNQGHTWVMWHHIVFRVKPTVLNVILFIVFQTFHIPYLRWVFFIHQTHINLRENDNRFITRLFQSVSFSLQTTGKTTCGEKVCRCRENLIFSPVFSSFLCFSAGSLLMLGRENKIKGSLIGRSQHLDGGVVSTLCVLEQTEKELKDGIESKIILRKHCLKKKKGDLQIISSVALSDSLRKVMFV